MINIYIGLSKNQIFSYESLIKKTTKDSFFKILITNKTLDFNPKLWDKIICSEESFNNQSDNRLNELKNIIFKIKQYKLIIKKLNTYKKEKKITLYFTYIEDILTNYLLFSFNKNIEGVVIEDGTLNYYNHSIKSIKKSKIFIKYFLSKINGISFKPYKGHSSGIEYDHVVKQYVRSPKLSLFPEKSFQLPYNKRKVNLNDTILIIGQEAYINLYGYNLYIERIKELFKIIKNNQFYNSCSKIYYKPHRNGRRIDYSILNKEFNEKEIELLSPNKPLEDLYFNDLGSKFIFAFDSSALINIYLETDDFLKDKIEFNSLLKYNKELKPIFERFKFKIFE